MKKYFCYAILTCNIFAKADNEYIFDSVNRDQTVVQYHALWGMKIDADKCNYYGFEQDEKSFNLLVQC